MTLNPFQINSLAIVQKTERALDRYKHFTAAVLHGYSTNSDPLFSTIFEKVQKLLKKIIIKKQHKNKLECLHTIII